LSAARDPHLGESGSGATGARGAGA